MTNYITNSLCLAIKVKHLYYKTHKQHLCDAYWELADKTELVEGLKHFSTNKTIDCIFCAALLNAYAKST